MEFIGEVDSLAALCREGGISYRNPGSLAYYRDPDAVEGFLDSIIDNPAPGSREWLYRAGAKGELIMLGKFDNYMNRLPGEPVPGFMIMNKALAAYEGLNDTYRRPDAILVCGHGVAVISVKYWAGHTKPGFVEKKLKPAITQLNRTASALDRILKKKHGDKIKKTVAILYDPNAPVAGTDLSPMGGVGIHYTNSVMEMIRDIMPEERDELTPEQAEEIKDYIVDYVEEEEQMHWSVYDDEDFPTMEELDEAGIEVPSDYADEWDV
jgi:hypothetical protein